MDPDTRPGPPGDPELLGRPRWRGEAGHLEVWYATFTDPDSGYAFWLHAELRVDLGGAPETHGWFAAFPPDDAPVVDRFGPVTPTTAAGDASSSWFEAGEVRIGPGSLSGRTARTSWRLTWSDANPPLFTFPAYAWQRELLPSAQVVPWPTAEVSGRVEVAGVTLELRGARGAVSRIAGEGNAHRWGWLHADLGGGDVLEVVAAQGRAAILRRVPPKVLAQLRLDGDDWPGDPLVAAASSRARLDLPRWSATVTGAARRLRVGVRIPRDGQVTLEYRDPDGARALCTNSCRADAEIRLERRTPTGWRPERSWSLRGTAHAEVGLRPHL